MPNAYRSVTCKVSTTIAGTREELETMAKKAIGVTLTSRGWDLLSCMMNSVGEAKVTYRRHNERNRGFYETTEPLWTTVQQRLAAQLVGSGWYSDELPAVVVAAKVAPVAAVAHPIASDEWRCCQCGIDNGNHSDCCMVCCSPRVVATTDDSELQRLLEAVETAQSNLRKFLARR